MLGNELGTRASEVNVSWVKGHARRVDIERGRTTDEDKRGNDGADALAVEGAHMHQASAEVVSATKQRKEWAVVVQRMMLSVLKARLAAERACRNDAEEGDRGSEIGCMDEFVLDDELDEEISL